MYATRSSQTGLAFRTHPTALPQACTLIGAAAMPEIDGNRQHTMRAEPICAYETAPDGGTGALCRRLEEFGRRKFRVLFQGGAYPFPSTDTISPPIPLRRLFEIIYDTVSGYPLQRNLHEVGNRQISDPLKAGNRQISDP